MCVFCLPLRHARAVDCCANRLLKKLYEYTVSECGVRQTHEARRLSNEGRSSFTRCVRHAGYVDHGIRGARRKVRRNLESAGIARPFHGAQACSSASAAAIHGAASGPKSHRARQRGGSTGRIGGGFGGETAVAPGSVQSGESRHSAQDRSRRQRVHRLIAHHALIDTSRYPVVSSTLPA
jgi:hypothetical protein